jgi:hypothetical protein
MSIAREFHVGGRVRYRAEHRLTADDHELVLARDGGRRAEDVF